MTTLGIHAIHPPARHFMWQRAWARRAHWIMLASALVVVILCMFWTSDWQLHFSSQPIIHTALVALTGLSLLCLISRVVTWRRYRVCPAHSNIDWPDVSVIVPIFNEGSRVLQTIRSLLSQDYPAGRLQIILVNDGSADDTPMILDGALRRWPARLMLITLSVNQGKRCALAHGFTQAKGTFVVTTDSDCVLDPKAIQHLVTPMLSDPQIAGVAGQTKVRHQRSCWLGGMLVAAFAMSFDIYRAGQSTSGTVLCLPGALSCWRKSAIQPLLQDWLAQTFRGRRCRIAEDRALTTMVLTHGWRTVYQQSALTHTVAPHSIRGIVRTYLRWTRGDLRENLLLLRQFFQQPRMLASNLSHQWMVAVVETFLPFGFFAIMLMDAFQQPGLIPLLVAGAVVGGILPMCLLLLTPHRRLFAAGMAFGCLWCIALGWILPWSIFTLRNDRWLTRAV